VRLTLLGWIFLVTAWCGVGGLTVWCLVRLLRAEKKG
jgi:hypothetical protein